MLGVEPAKQASCITDVSGPIIVVIFANLKCDIREVLLEHAPQLAKRVAEVSKADRVYL